MTMRLMYWIVAIMLGISFYGCSESFPLYSRNDNGKYVTGELTEAGFENVRKILRQYSTTGLKDTLLIKYDYIHDPCWDLLDRHGDDYIRTGINGKQAYIQNVTKERSNISVFTFREEGSDISKYKKWDSTTLIDQRHQLFDLLFSTRSECGNSIAILPDREYVLIRSDAHFQLLAYSSKAIAALLKK